MSGFSLAPIRMLFKKRRMAKLAKRLNNQVKDNTNGNVLTPEERDEAIRFYRETTGMKIDPIYHNYQKEKTGKFYKEYIPDDLFYNYIDPYFNRIKERSLDNKCYYDLLFAGFAMPKSYLKRLNGIWFDGEEHAIDKETVNAVLLSHPAVFIKKAFNTGGGKGVFYLSNESGDIVSRFWEIIGRIDEDVVIQEPLKQHPALSRVNESSVNTIRVLSMLRPDGSIKIYSVVLRMGMAGKKVDNASSGGITCGVNLDGHCKEAGYYSYVNGGKRLLNHPTSGMPFKDIFIPNMDKIIAFVEKAAVRIPHFRLVSWDIALRDDGEPVLIEANFYDGEIDFHQLNNGPLFKEDTEAILREVFSK